MAESVFSGQTYNPSMNTRTHYKAGNNEPRRAKRKKRVNKPKVESIGIGSYDPNDKYGTMSVFKK